MSWIVQVNAEKDRWVDDGVAFATKVEAEGYSKLLYRSLPIFDARVLEIKGKPNAKWVEGHIEELS